MKLREQLTTHLYGFTPRSALTCAIEGGQPGDGGAPTTPAAPVTPPANNGAPAITPEVQALIEAARADERTKTSNSVWKQARETYEKRQGGQPPATKPETVTTQQPQTVDVRAEVARIRSFERAAGAFGLSPAAIELLEQDFNTANPQDPAAWVTQRATAFGWKPAGSATPATPAPETPAPKSTPQGAPVTGSGAPANPTTVVTDDTPILRMSEGDRIALMKRIGQGPYVERMRKEFREGNVRVRFNKG